MKTNIDIFSGFLGSGKTMLIKKLLSENAYNQNTVIIENEFGEVGIDGLILKENNIEVKEINSGCICCQVSGRFGDAVSMIINKYKPENIIIEPSGVAKLSEILKILEAIKFDGKINIRNIFTLVDVQKYDMYLKNFKEFYVNQIKQADKVVLSRTQLIESKKVQNIMDSLKKLNPNASIIYKPWNQLKAYDFFNKKGGKRLSQNNEIKKKELTVLNEINYKTFKKENNENLKIGFESFPIDLSTPITTKEIEKKFKLICDNEKFGEIIRAKGVIEEIDGSYYQFDYVPNEFNTKKIKWSNRKVISIIGNKLNKKEIELLFKGGERK